MNPYESSAQLQNIDGIMFHYALQGDAEKPLLALVNPASQNLTCWEVVLDDLLKHFQVLRFDIRGTGKSGWGADDEFTFSQYADDLAALMDSLGLSKAFVLGVAYGARTAAQFALRHEDKLSALGLFDVALTPPVVQTGQHALGEQARVLLAEAGEEMPERQKYWRFYENRDAALLAHTAHEHEPDTSALLGHLKVPALIVCGRQDMNLAEAQRIAAAMPGSEFHLMEMTGHGSLFFRPKMFVELVAGLGGSI
jgi:3-oxoadipate enol-lactonase